MPVLLCPPHPTQMFPLTNIDRFFLGVVPTIEDGKEESDEALSSDAATIAEREKLKKVLARRLIYNDFLLTTYRYISVL